MSRRLTDRLTPMIEEVLDDLAQGDDVSWDFAMESTPNGPVGLLYLFLPSGIIGQTLNTSVTWTNPLIVSPLGVADAVRQMLEALRTARSDQLAQAPGVNQGGGG